MKRLVVSGFLAAMALLPAAAHAQDVQAFGGLTVRGLNTASTFGANVAVPLGDHVQIIGEGGRMSNVISGPLALALSFSPIDVNVRAYYGEGGVRLIGSESHAVRPYAEGTLGFAKLRTNVTGIGDPGVFVNSALGFLGSTQPVFGGGGGVIIQSGPVLVDFGYRYHRFGTGNPVQNVLTGGAMDVHQVRFGFGVRF